MQITDLWIRNFKTIRNMHIQDIENALILVGQNNTGKTAVLEALRAVIGDYEIREEDFLEDYPNIEIVVSLKIQEEDLRRFHRNGIVSTYRRYDSWMGDFCRKLPSYQNGVLCFSYIANREGKVRYADGVRKNNGYIPQIIPNVYYLDAQRNMGKLQDVILMLQEDVILRQMRSECCMFDQAKKCNHCFSCIGLIHQKTTEELNAFETAKLLEYKLYHSNLDSFAKKVNRNFRKNGGREEILYSMNLDMEKTLSVTGELYHKKQNRKEPLSCMGKGMRSIYMLSLLETCEENREKNTDIIIVENPEIFLHPKLQKISGEILYRLSKRNQVIFSTHSPNLLPNFNSRQIRQIILDGEG